MNVSSTVVFLSPAASPKDSFTEVITFLTISIILFVLYFLTLIIIFREKNFKHSYYTLTSALGVADLINLFHLGFSPTVGYYGLKGVIDSTIGQPYMIVTVGIGWFGSFLLNLAIAANRFVAVVFYSQYQRIFSPLFTRLLTIICFIFGVVLALPFCVMSTVLCPHYDENGTKIAVINNLILGSYKSTQFSVAGSISILIVFLYTLSLVIAVQKFKSLNVNRPKYIGELKMLAQGCFGALFCCLFSICIFIGPPIISSTLTKIFNTIYAGMNPVIYLILDSNLRFHFLRYITVNKIQKFQTSSTAPVERFRQDK